MPTFRAAPSSDLGSAIRRAMASSNMGPLAEMQADMAAASTAKNMSLAEKARAEVEQMQRAEADRANPQLATEYAGNAAGMNMPDATRLSNHLRGVLEQPGPGDQDDAMMVGKDAQPYVTGAPNVPEGQRRGFQSALASLIANRLATGHTNADQLTQAGGNINKTALQNEASDAPTVPDANRLVAAMAGKVREPYKTNAQGTVLNEETGELNEGTQLAGAVRNHLGAQAAKERAQAETAASGGKPPSGYAWGPNDAAGNRTLVPIAGGPAGAVGKDALTPEAIDMLAREGLKDKSALANVGRGVQGARDLRSILNRMTEISASESGPGMAQRRQEFRADANSLNKMTMSYDAITAFEKTAVRNGDVLVQLGKKVDATGVPVIEKWIRAGRQATGDVDVSEFNAQMMLYRAEAARILVNPNLTGQLTDSARHEIEEFLKGNASAPQIERVVGRLKTDFENRKKTLEEQMDEARNRMAGRAAPPKAAATGGDVEKRFAADPSVKGMKLGTVKDGKAEVLDASGKLVGYYE